MARITVEDCLENIPNRFALVLITAQRTKELLKNAKPLLINDERENKQIVTSLREVAAGYISADKSEYDEQMHFNNPEAGPLRRNFRMVDEDLPPEF